jgi:hypothetical protein
MERIVSRARSFLDAHFDSIISHRGSDGHIEENTFMPLSGAAKKDSCIFVKPRRISVRPENVGRNIKFQCWKFGESTRTC